MKIYFFEKYTALTALMLICFATYFFSLNNTSQSTFSGEEKLLPIYSVETNKMVVSITFDTAWGNEDIDKIISVLKEHNCSSTFFITGQFMDKYPGDVKKLYSAGHEVANHSNSHEHFNSLSKEEIKKSILECNNKILSLTGSKNILFRAPYGEYNNKLISVCRSINIYPVQWSLDSLDYENLTLSQIKNRILPKLKCGDIILFHTGTKNTADYLCDILCSISEKGYKYKTVGSLIHKGDYSVDFRGRQFKNYEIKY